MGDNAKELKIPITITADTAGAVVAEKALDEITIASSKTAAAIEQADKASDKVSGTFKQTFPNAQKVADGLKQVDDAATRAARSASGQPFQSASASMGAAGAAAQRATQPINDLKGAFSGLERASHGGAEGMLGAAEAVTKFDAFVQTLRSLNPVIAVLTAVTVAFALLKDKIVDLLNNTKANDRATKDLTDRAAALKLVYAELEKAATASFEKQSEGIKKVTDSFTELIGQADAARQRIDKLNDAQTNLRLSRVNQSEASELAAATTDEQRAAIKTKNDRQRSTIRGEAADNKLTASENNAQIDIRSGQKEISDLIHKRDEAKANVISATSDFENAKDKLKIADQGGTPVDSQLARELRDQVREAKKAMDLAVENFGKLEESINPAIATAQKKVDDAKETVALTSVEKKTKGAEDVAVSISQKVEDKAVAAARKKQIDDLGKQAEDAASKGDLEGQSTAVDARNKLLKQAAAEKAPQDLSAFSPRKSQGQASKDVIQLGGGALPGDKAKPLDTKPIEQGAKDEADNFSAVEEKSQEAINATGDTISKIKPPEPLNLDPISTGFTGYHEINMEAHKESQKRIAEAEKDIDRLRQQLSELARSARN